MRAVMGICDEMPSIEQRGDLGRFKMLSGFHRSLAGDHVQELGQQPVTAWRNRLGPKVFSKVANQAVRENPREHGRNAANKDRITSKRLNLDSKLVQKIAMFNHQGRLGALELDRLGDEQTLRLDSTACNPSPQFLVQNPLMERMLVDYHHAIPSLGDEVTIMDLNRLQIGLGQGKPLSG
jgi:hypothetical protein